MNNMNYDELPDIVEEGAWLDNIDRLHELGKEENRKARDLQSHNDDKEGLNGDV